MELFTNEEMKAADIYAIKGGISGPFLMDRAGQHVASVAEAVSNGPCHVHILAGPGNNGGDAFIAAKYLKARGYEVSLDLLGKKENLKGDAAWALDEWQRASGACHVGIRQEALTKSSLIIDGLFGAGLDRSVEGPFAKAIAVMNNSGKPIIAIDVPSGVNGNTGQIMGVATKAGHTVTFFRLKPGHLLYPGRELAGQIHLKDIGIPARAVKSINPQQWQNNPAIWENVTPLLSANHHKYGKGAVLVASVKGAMTGANHLAASAALRAGAGLVTMMECANNLPAHTLYAAIIRAEMPERKDWPNWLAAKKITACLFGPGAPATKETRSTVQALLKAGKNLCLDAGAITAFEGEAENFLKALNHKRDFEVVLTPHEGEFKRLFGPYVTGGKLADARKAAKAAQSVIVLKGADTVIAAPDGRAVINDNAPPTLATAGSGDVLAGIITAHLAKGMPAFEAAAQAVYRHGAAATHVKGSLIADDLLTAL